MKKEIENLVNSLREGTAGKTCMGTGNFSLDIITQREYPDGFVVGKRNILSGSIRKDSFLANATNLKRRCSRWRLATPVAM